MEDLLWLKAYQLLDRKRLPHPTNGQCEGFLLGTEESQTICNYVVNYLNGRDQDYEYFPMAKSFIAEHHGLGQVWLHAYKQKNGGQSSVGMARDVSGLRELCTFTLVLKSGSQLSSSQESPGKPGVFVFRVYIDDKKYIYSRWC